MGVVVHVRARRVSIVERYLIRALHRRGATQRALAVSFGRPLGTVHGLCRNVRVARPRRTDEATRLLAKQRRDELRAEKLCINGREHGPATHGCLCWPCRQTHRGSS